MIDFFQYLLDRYEGKTPKGEKRHKDWRKVRAAFLEKNPRCFVCGSNKRLIVHHCVPFWMDRSLELQENNLMTMCQHGRFKSINCHLLIGHLGNFQRINPNCVQDAFIWQDKLDVKDDDGTSR